MEGITLVDGLSVDGRPAFAARLLPPEPIELLLESVSFGDVGHARVGVRRRTRADPVTHLLAEHPGGHDGAHPRRTRRHS